MGQAYIIDDHRLFSAGMRRLVGSLDGVDTVTCYDTPNAALAADTPPEEIILIVSDLYMPGVDTVGTLPELCATFPNATVVVISSSISQADKTACLTAGAVAFFEKHQDPDIVLEALQNLLDGGEPPSAGPLGTPALPEAAMEKGLTHRQVDILVQLARGHTMKEIAITFDISAETVKTHLANIYRLLEVTGRSNAADWARQHGLV